MLNKNSICVSTTNGVTYQVVNETFTGTHCADIKTFLNLSHGLYNDRSVCLDGCSSASYYDTNSGIYYCDNTCIDISTHLSGTPTLYNVLGACYIAGDSYLTGMAKYVVSGGDTYYATLCNQIQLYLSKAALYN